MTTTELDVDYVLPLRWQDDRDLADLAEYLRGISPYVRIIVVDGSDEELFRSHCRTLDEIADVVRPCFAGRNGKVTGVLTGLARCHSEHVVIADDDVRYNPFSLAAVVAALADADLVGPQNYFSPSPWHARWDTARSLLNRCFGADYPGTFAVRRSRFVAMGGYSATVLFENLELMRTVRAAGGRVSRPLGIYVERRPPSSAKFFSQRIRQAYDDLAQPPRAALFLAVVPAVLVTALRRPGWLIPAAAAIVGMAEVGRRRAGGRSVLPASGSLLAPLWVLERGICSWLAVGCRWRYGGVRFGPHRLRRAAHSNRELRAMARHRRDALLAEPEEGSGRPVRPLIETVVGEPAALM